MGRLISIKFRFGHQSGTPRNSRITGESVPRCTPLLEGAAPDISEAQPNVPLHPSDSAAGPGTACTGTPIAKSEIPPRRANTAANHMAGILASDWFGICSIRACFFYFGVIMMGTTSVYPSPYLQHRYSARPGSGARVLRSSPVCNA